MKKVNWPTLLIFILATELVGILSSWLSGNIAMVYRFLAKPPLSPPGWLFGIVWIVLYAMIGVAAYLIYRDGHKEKNENLALYGIQMFLNFLWPILFFRFGLLWLSFAEILMLDAAVFLMVQRFKKVNAFTVKLLLPYFLWLLFATYLNLGTAILN